MLMRCSVETKGMRTHIVNSTLGNRSVLNEGRKVSSKV